MDIMRVTTGGSLYRDLLSIVSLGYFIWEARRRKVESVIGCNQRRNAFNVPSISFGFMIDSSKQSAASGSGMLLSQSGRVSANQDDQGITGQIEAGPAATKQTHATDVCLRHPGVQDGPAIDQMVRDSGVLDRNSRYVYLLWSQYFSQQSLIAENSSGLLGFVTGFLVPDRPEVLFIWQVAVSPAARGQGLAGRMLDRLIQQHVQRGGSWLEAHVGPSNRASEKLFRSTARRWTATLDVQDGYLASDFLPFPTQQVPQKESSQAGQRQVARQPVDFGEADGGGHEPERLFRVGPLPQNANPAG